MRPQSTPHLWSAQEDEYVRHNFLTSTVAEMAAYLGRTKASVRARKTTLRLGGKWRPWTEDEVSTLRCFYSARSAQALDLDGLAACMGRSADALALKAGRLGLSDTTRPRTCRVAWRAEEDAYLRANPGLTWAESARGLGRSMRAVGHRRGYLGITMSAAERTAALHRVWQAHGGHPRGFKGHTHGPAARAKMRVVCSAQWLRARETGTGFMSDQDRQRRSDLMALRQSTDPRLRQAYSRSAGGVRADLGFYVRSRWEANIARYLKWLQERGDIHAWAYEAKTFWFEHIKRGTRSYTPDFEIVERSGSTPKYWEVKGWKHPRGQTALARMERYYPEVDITIVDEDAYKAIAKWKALIPHWETGSGSHHD